MAEERWEEVEDSVSAQVAEEDLLHHNRIDRSGYAVYDESSFLGWAGQASRASPHGDTSRAVQSQIVAVMNNS